MTMAMPYLTLPPEIQAAKETLAAAYKDSMPGPRAWVSRIVLYAGTMLIGAGLGYGLVASEIVSASAPDFWRGALTAISVLSGFMITTMVFTGKIEAAKSLSATELRDVAAKVTHLLLYQFGTLANHVLCLCTMFLTPAVAAKWPALSTPAATISLALFFVSIARSIFVPLQIIEIHRFTHAALMRDKRDEAAKEIEKM